MQESSGLSIRCQYGGVDTAPAIIMLSALALPYNVVAACNNIIEM